MRPTTPDDAQHIDPAAAAGRDWLYRRVGEAIARDADLAPLNLEPLTGLNTDVTGRSGFLKIYFGLRCECTTAAVLSLEVASGKSRGEVEIALPALLGKVKLQADAFRNMDCAAHRRLRSAGLA